MEPGDAKLKQRWTEPRTEINAMGIQSSLFDDQRRLQRAQYSEMLDVESPK
jgi:hypothetical protein